MRRSTLLALGLPFALLASCGRREHRFQGPAPDARPGRPVHIVVLGDSLAFGTGASAPRNAFVFRAFLRVLARRPGSRLDNYAIGGARTADVTRLEVPRLRGVAADAVVICVGGNDVVHRGDAAGFARQYAALVAGVRALQPRAALICCGVPDVGASPLFTGADHDDVTRLSREDDAAVRAIARRPGAYFVDLFAVTDQRRGDPTRFLSEDRFHPSDAGYALFADALAPVVQRALDDRR